MRILLIEDDKKISEFIRIGLKEAGYITDHAENGEDGLHLATTGSYDVAVIDIMLPKLDGLTIINEIRQKDINIPIIILSAKNTVDDRIRGLEKGSDDYLTKPFSFSELLARIQALVRRATRSPDSTILSVDDLSLNLLAREVRRNDNKVELQPLEFDLLAYLMRNVDRVVSKTMIMEHVWDYDFVPSTNVVEARISKLRDKIDKDFEIKLIHTIRGVGYVIKRNN